MTQRQQAAGSLDNFTVADANAASGNVCSVLQRRFEDAAEGGLARLPRLGGRSTQPRGAGEEVASLGLADGPAGGLAVAGARCVAVAGHRQQVGPHGHEVV